MVPVEEGVKGVDAGLVAVNVSITAIVAPEVIGKVHGLEVECGECRIY